MWDLVVFAGQEVRWSWPLPPDGDHRVAVTVDAACTVNLQAWLEGCRAMIRGPVAPRAAMDDHDGTTRVHLVSLIAEMCKSPHCHHVAKQLVWQIASRLEKSILHAAEHSGQLFGNGSVQSDGFATDATHRQVDRALVEYWQAGRLAAHQEGAAMMCSIAVDNSAVGGRRLLNCAVALPSNKAWWCPPQAASEHGGRPRRMSVCSGPWVGSSSEEPPGGH